MKGVYSLEGREIIPTVRGYKEIKYHTDEKIFEVEGNYSDKNKKIKVKLTGICDSNGKEIIPLSKGYGEIQIKSGFYYNDEAKYYVVKKWTNDKISTGICDINGKEIFMTNFGGNGCKIVLLEDGQFYFGKKHSIYRESEKKDWKPTGVYYK